MIFVYYAGHGVMDNMTFALCNGNPLTNGENGKVSKSRFNLENAVRAVGQVHGAYVLSVFDCCREALKPNMRGNNAILSDDDPSELNPAY